MQGRNRIKTVTIGTQIRLLVTNSETAEALSRLGVAQCSQRARWTPTQALRYCAKRATPHLMCADNMRYHRCRCSLDHRCICSLDTVALVAWIIVAPVAWIIVANVAASKDRRQRHVLQVAARSPSGGTFSKWRHVLQVAARSPSGGTVRRRGTFSLLLLYLNVLGRKSMIV
jgi:hypothetical protein